MEHLKELFLLRKDITYLNFGSFGACPRPVFEQYQRYQLELEQQPVEFVVHNSPKYLLQGRQALAQYVNCDADDVVLVTNPSYAVNIIAKGLQLAAGDEILTTDIEYGACDKTWSLVCKQNAALYKRQHITLPFTDEDSIVDQLFSGLTSNTKLIFVSHITSSTALILPVAKIVQRAKGHGIPVFVDGAHVPGHIALDLTALSPAYYTGACHKWMMTPKGCSFLYTSQELQASTLPLVVSWGFDSATPSHSQYIDYHQLQGTRDVSSMLCIPAAIEFMQQHNWAQVAHQCKTLVHNNAARFSNLLKTECLAPVVDQYIGQMLSVPIRCKEPANFKAYLLDTYKIEIPIMQHDGSVYLRYSLNAFNDQQDMDALYNALHETLRSTNYLEV
jgi:isopenicillin-N epimerase